MALSLIRDNEFWHSDKFVASCGPWGAGNLAPGTWFDMAAMQDDASGVFRWSFPKVWPQTGAYGYNYIAYGRYWQEAAKKPVTPLRLGDLKNFDFYHDVVMTNPDSANMLGEFFASDASGALHAEIGWYQSAPAPTVGWFKAGKLLGTYTNRTGRKFEVREQPSGAAGRFIMIMPADGSKLLTATMDALSAVRFLIAGGHLDPSLLISGFALGFEPVGGDGAAEVRKFQVALA